MPAGDFPQGFGIHHSREEILQSARCARNRALGLPLCDDPVTKLSRYR